MKSCYYTFIAAALVITGAARAQLATGINYNATNPAAPTGQLNVHWQNDGGRPTVNASAYVTYPTYQVACPTSGDLSAPVAAIVGWLNATYGGIVDARACSGATGWTTALTITEANTVILLPCATLTATQPLTVAAGTRNVAIHGCSFEGGSLASGTAGGTVWLYTGASFPFVVGDQTYSTDTPGFLMDNMNINIASGGGSAIALAFYRAQEIRLDNLYLNGNGSTGQVGILLDGTGNYTGGAFFNLRISQFGAGVLLTGDQTSLGIDDYANASTFVKMHINCPESGGSPISGTSGFDIAGGDGNTIAGGDVEGCAIMTHLGPKATSNTIIGLRNEISTVQYQADAGSTYNYVATGGTFYTGDLIDNGEHNSFSDAFHRTVNGMTGDWYASQQDATITNHYRLGTGTGNERGLLNEIQTDYGYRWEYGFTDATAGEQFFVLDDLLANVLRLSIGQYNGGSASTNAQTALNSAGTGAIVLNGSNHSGTGGTIFGSGGATATTVATIDQYGDADFLGNLTVAGVTTLAGSGTVKNLADAEIDFTLWAGLSTAQKESFTYKDYTGTSQWYMLKDTTNNWALNSAIGALDAIKAYQSGNSGDLYLNTANSTGAIRLNYEAGSSGIVNLYAGGSSTLEASFRSASVIQFPGMAAPSGHYLLQVDNAGYITSTPNPCTSGCGTGSVTSVGVSVPSDESVTGSPITSTGTIAITRNNSAAGLFLAGPCSGSSAAPTYRALCSADIPANAANTTGNAATATALAATPTGCSSHQWSNSIAASGNLGCSQPNYTDLAGSVPNNSANTTGNASTASALAALPTPCSSGQAPTGVLANGNSTGCAPFGTAEWGTATTFSSTSATQYVGKASLNNGSQSDPFIAPRTGTMQNCTVAVSSAQSATAYYTANLYKNGSLCSSGPTVTLNSTSSNAPISDNTHTCSVNQGDRLSWQLVPTNTPATSLTSASCLY